MHFASLPRHLMRIEIIPPSIHATVRRVFIAHILTNEKTLGHISLLMLPRTEEANTIDGLSKKYLDWRRSKAEIIPILLQYVYINRPLMVLNALRGSVATLALQCRVMNPSAQLRPRNPSSPSSACACGRPSLHLVMRGGACLAKYKSTGLE